MIPVISKANSVTFVVVMLAMFSVGATIGASAAISDDVTHEQVQENISQIDEQAVQDIKNDTSGVRKSVSVAVVGPGVESGVTIAKLGADFGYQYPHVAEILGYLTPFAVIGGFALQLRRVIK